MILGPKRWLDTLLITTALVLGGYLVFTVDRPTSDQRAARADHVLPLFAAHELKQIEFSSADERFVITQVPSAPGEYRIEGDQDSYVNPALLRELTAALEFATWKRCFEDQPTRNAPDLKGQPLLLVTVSTAFAKESLELFGSTEVSQSSKEGEVYARVVSADQKPRSGVVSKTLFNTLKRSKQEFRGNQLLPFSMDSTLSLSISDKHGSLELIADELGFLLGSTHTRADRQLSDVLFFHLAQATLSSFVDEDEAKSRIEADPNQLKVIQRGPGRDVTVLFGGSCPGDEDSLLALRTSAPPVSGCVKKTVKAGLTLKENDLRDRTATLFASDEIDHVIVSGQERSVDVLRKDAGYVLVSREQAEVPREAGDEFLRLLAEAHLEVLSSPPASSAPTATLTVVGNPRQKRLNFLPTTHAPSDADDTNSQRQELEIHASNSEVLVHRLDDDVWLRVPEALHWVFSQDDAWARPRELAPLPAEKITQIRVERYLEGKSTPWSVESVLAQDSGFAFEPKLTSAPSWTPDTALCRQLWTDISELRASRFIAGKQRPSQPLYRILFGGPAGPTNHELIVGSRVRGGFEAWASFSESNFVLPYEVALSLATPLYDRSAGRIDVEDFNELSLNADGRITSLVRVAGRLEVQSSELSQDLVEPLEEAVAGLTVLARIPEQASLLEQRPVGKPILVIRGRRASANQPEFVLEIFKLAPYQDDLSHLCRVQGQAGVFVIAADRVQTLLGLL